MRTNSFFDKELEGDRKLLFDHQKDWKGVAHKAEDSFLKERTELVSQLSTFRNQNSLLTEIVSKLQQEKRHEDSKYQLEIEQNLQTSLSLQAEITNLKEEINLVRQREKDKDWAYNASQTKLLEAERNVLELKHVSADSESVYQVRKELKGTILHLNCSTPVLTLVDRSNVAYQKAGVSSSPVQASKRSFVLSSSQHRTFERGEKVFGDAAWNDGLPSETHRRIGNPGIGPPTRKVRLGCISRISCR